MGEETTSNQPAYSILGQPSDMSERIFLEDISKLMDQMYIFNTVGWSNHGDPSTTFYNNKINDWFFYDREIDKIIPFSFDEVTYVGFHGFAGTDYTKDFRLKTKRVMVGYNNFAPTIQQLKEIEIKHVNREIQRIERLVNDLDGLRDKINLINSL